MLSFFFSFFLSVSYSKTNTLVEVTQCLDGLAGEKGVTESVCGGSIGIRGIWTPPSMKEVKYKGMDGYFRFQKNMPIEFIGVNPLDLIEYLKDKKNIKDGFKCSIEHNMVLENGNLQKRHFFVNYSSNELSGTNNSSGYSRGYMSFGNDADKPKVRCPGALLKVLSSEEVTKSALEYMKETTLSTIESIKGFILSNSSSKSKTNSFSNRECKDRISEMKTFLNDILKRLKNCKAYQAKESEVKNEILALIELILNTEVELARPKNNSSQKLEAEEEENLPK